MGGTAEARPTAHRPVHPPGPASLTKVAPLTRRIPVAFRAAPSVRDAKPEVAAVAAHPAFSRSQPEFAPFRPRRKRFCADTKEESGGGN